MITLTKSVEPRKPVATIELRKMTDGSRINFKKKLDLKKTDAYRRLIRRVYIDHKNKYFCDTHVGCDVSIPPTYGRSDVLGKLSKDLLTMGYTQTSRRAFEILCN